ncbi:DUF6915 family protein [Flaviaesturariibacter amylovorans]|uniref:DUF6915 domain-containing protein n=1 Tax=Flaviaesturariibacter amylovorans TaxID=1084520 RepID=A0ABP8HST7_9BACT
MNYWKHSLLSRKKFGGLPDDYFAIHRFLDSSKLYFYDMRHRALLHHTFGIALCTRRFGETLVNADGRTVLVRDVAAEHCREDLMGIVPTLNNWFRNVDARLAESLPPIDVADPGLQEFLLEPFLMSGLKASLVITHSNFGVHLARELFGSTAALELAQQLDGTGVNELLPLIRLQERWQYTPDLKQLKDIEHEQA